MMNCLIRNRKDRKMDTEKRKQQKREYYLKNKEEQEYNERRAT